MSQVPIYLRDASKVYIIESPRSTEILHDIGESDVLKDVLKLYGMDCSRYLVVDRVAFQMSLEYIANDIKSYDKNQYGAVVPFLHLSCHGSEDGIQLTSQKLSWYDVAEDLNRLNIQIGYLEEPDYKVSQLTVCMSACEGISAVQLKNQGFDEIYAALIGSKRKPSWAETVAGFTSFYFTTFFKHGDAKASIKTMNAAVGETDLFVSDLGNGLKKLLSGTK